MGCVSLKFLFSRNAYHHRRNNAFGQIFQDIREGVPPENFQENIYAEYRIFVTIIESTWRQTPSLRPDMTILLTWLEHAISGKEGYMQGSYATNKFYVQQARRKSSDRSLESLLTGGLLQGTFRICLTSNIRDYNLQEVIKRALDATRVDGFHYLDVDKEFARLEVILEDSHVCFKILNSAASYLGLSCIPSRVCQEHVKSTVRVVQAAARFDRYLRLTPKIRPFQDGVQMEFTQVKSLGRLSMHSLPIYEGVGINLCKGNQVRIPDQEGLYGLKIINHSRYDFYVHLFRFNPSNFSIETYYPSSISPQFAGLPSESVLTIGDGASGGKPWSHRIRDSDVAGPELESRQKQDLDITFFKIFLTLKPMDLTFIAQGSPFNHDFQGESTLAFESFLEKLSLWDSDTISIVTQRKREPLNGPQESR